MASQTQKEEVTRIIQARQASSSNSGEVGSNRGAGSNSVSGLLSTLIPVFIFAAVALLLFLILRKTYRRVYNPRTYIGVLKEHEHTPKPSGGFFGWVKDYRALPDSYVLNHQSIDGYLFLRFFKLLIIICLVGVCLTWPILFPVNATGGGGESGLEALSFANVANPNRYYAHCFVAWVFLGFVMFAIIRETVFYISLRQAYLLSPRMASRISSRTVLFTSVPDYYLHQGRLRAVFPDVKQLWITTDCGELEELVDDRDQTAFKLEDAEITLSKTANKKRLKKGESHGKPEEWISQNDRPTHRLKPIIGQKVDTINWCRSHLKSIIPQVERMQAAHREGEAEWIPAVFIEFNTQRAAQAAWQQVAHHKALNFAPRTIGSTPDDIIWKNLGISEWQHIVRTYAATAIVLALTLFWTPFTAFIGVLTNINYLVEQVPWLGFINNIPPAILGVITGLLPTLLLALLVILFPIFCRFLARLVAGEVTYTDVELKTQTWYFIFQVIQVFLITTFTSGAASVAAQIASNPTAAPTLLAQNLPKASNFYISYFILYGLAQTALKLLSMAGILTIVLLSKFLDKTPRKKYNRWINLTGLQWGSEYPKWTNLGVIAIAYSCIAPLVLGFACLAFLLLYLAFRYNFLYVYTTTIDTRGLNYGKALQQLTTGVYLAELCLIGLFAIGTSGSATSSGPLILMIIFLIATILFHITARKSLHRLTRNLPLTLEVEAEEEYDAHSKLEAGANRGKTNGFSYDGAHPNSFDSNGQYRSTPVHGTKRPKPISKGRKEGDTVGDQSSFFTTFFNPKQWTSYEQLRRSFRSSLHDEPVPPYPASVERDAYLHPAIKSPTPQLWIVHDEIGISAREIHDTQSIISITDEGTYFDEKNNVVWDQDHIEKAPLWEQEEMRMVY